MVPSTEVFNLSGPTTKTVYANVRVNSTTARKSVKQRDAVGFTQWTRRVCFVYRLYEYSLFHKTGSEIKITQDTHTFAS